MCLAVPGKIISIEPSDDPLKLTGKVDFGGVAREVCLAYVPEAQIGNYVVVHVGFALSVIDETEAQKIFEYLREMEELADALPSTPADEQRAGNGP
jgi:hydrogenase expression/formation protein HypC